MACERPNLNRWTLELVSLPGQAAPPEVRMRRLLKVILRCFGFRCVRHSSPSAVGHADLPDGTNGTPKKGAR